MGQAGAVVARGARRARAAFAVRLRNTGPFRYRRARNAVRDPARLALLSQVQDLMDLPKLQRKRRVRGSIWAVSLVKNEADIIGPVVEHMFRQGVDSVMILDNGSTDDTIATLEALADRFPIHLGTDRSDAHLQGIKMSVLAEAARKAGADWVIPFDADEFWYAEEGTLRDFLQMCRAVVVEASMYTLFPVEGVDFGQGPWRLEPAAGWSKVAFRGHRYVRLAEGNHAVLLPGKRRSIGLRVLHVPWRSYEQFRRKARQGTAALSQADMPAGIGRHWRYIDSLDEVAARDVWRRLLNAEQVEGICWSPSGQGAATPVDLARWTAWDPDEVLTMR